MILYYILCLFSFLPAMAMGTFVGSIKPECRTQCGDVTVPYPFGIANDNDTSCSLNGAFILTCDTSTEPPKLYLGRGNIEIYNISDSELRIDSEVVFSCYNKNGTVSSDLQMVRKINVDQYIFSEKNKLTVIGCDDYSLIKGRTSKAPTNDFSSGCISSCIQESDVANDGKCSGKGCCLIPIANGLKSYEVELNSFQNHTDVWSFNQCSFAFIGEEGKFEFRASDLSNVTELRNRIRATVPVVMDWVIATNRNCSEDTECKENSECYDVESGGYRCKCNQGYEGNPYIDSGCQDTQFASMAARCYCGLFANVACSWTDTNPGRRFYCCGAGAGGCGFFAWFDPPMCQRAVDVIPGLLRSKNKVEAVVRLKEREARRLKLCLYGSWVLFALVMWLCY